MMKWTLAPHTRPRDKNTDVEGDTEVTKEKGDGLPAEKKQSLLLNPEFCVFKSLYRCRF